MGNGKIKKAELERRRKIGEAHKGRKFSKETIGKMREARKGKTYEEIYGTERAKIIRNKLSEKRKDQNHWNWKGGESQRYCSTLAHRVWEEWWNQKVPVEYIIHHIKSIKNNIISNLALLTRSTHKKIHWVYKKSK